MKPRILLATAALAVLPTVALAQANGEIGNPFNNPFEYGVVPPDQPFGAIDVAGAGATPAEVMAYLATLTGAQVVELIQRCDLINPFAVVRILPNAAEGGEAAQGAGGAAANPGANPPDAYAGRPDYAVESVSFCTNLQRVIFSDVAIGLGAGYHFPP